MIACARTRPTVLPPGRDGALRTPQSIREGDSKPQTGKKKIPLETQNRLAELFQPLKEYTRHAYNDLKCLGFARPINGQITEKNIQTGVKTLLENCAKGQLDRVRYVLNNFPQIFDRAESKDLLLSAANDLSILRFLCDCGKTDVSDAPVIRNACKSKKDVKERLDLLFELGADINAKNGDGEPPIVVAAEAFNIKAIRWLLKHGADKTATNANGETARDIVLKNKEAFDWKNVLKSL